MALNEIPVDNPNIARYERALWRFRIRSDCPHTGNTFVIYAHTEEGGKKYISETYIAPDKKGNRGVDRIVEIRPPWEEYR
tara:strand:+ start:304 stop:543 length:240 start_codon:yes stop_codon:yes gene_type:complete